MKTHILCLPTLFCAALVAVGCDLPTTPDSNDADGRSNDDIEALAPPTRVAAPTPLVWGPCPDGFISECLNLKVPLNWRHHGKKAQKINVLVSRLPARKSPSYGQLWLLQGGPGGSGAIFAEIADTVFAAYRDHYDLMVLEHRGVGESTRLSCPDQEAESSDGGLTITPAEFDACLGALVDEWDDGLGYFNITQAARDLAHAIEMTWRPHKRVYVYGVSYGTLWAQRFAQIAPYHADALVLDSVLPPNGISVFDFDKQFDPVGADLAALCAEDSLCAEKLGDDPWSTIEETVDALAHGHCSELFLPAELASLIGAIQAGNLTLRRHLFPFFYRLHRCTPGDRLLLDRYLNTLSSVLNSGPPDTRFSPLLQMNIAFAEIQSGDVPSFAQTLSACTEAALCPQFSLDLRQYFDAWPTYDGDRYFQRWFHPTVPVLALNGDLDPQTPWQQASRIEKHLHWPWQHYVQIPYAPHVATDRSPVNDSSDPPCGAQIMKKFLDRPYRRLNLQCLDDLAPINFDLPDGESTFFFGQSDEWEGPGPAPLGGPAHPIDRRILLDRLRTLSPIEVTQRLAQHPWI